MVGFFTVLVLSVSRIFLLGITAVVSVGSSNLYHLLPTYVQSVLLTVHYTMILIRI